MRMLRKGDLCHVPQDVQLWTLGGMFGGPSFDKTTEPTTAVFIEELPAAYLLFVKGRKMLAKKNHIYPHSDLLEVPVGQAG
jgi:hypothetical protein